MTAANPLVVAWLVLASTCLAITTTDPVLLLTLLVLVIAASAIAAGPRRSTFRTFVGVSAATTAAWLVATLVLPGSQDGAVLWHRGGLGDLTTSGVLDGAVAAVRVAVVVLLLGLALQLTTGPHWSALARNALGGLAPLVAPLCMLGQALSETAVESARARRLGLRACGSAATWRRAVRLAVEHEPVAGNRTGDTLRLLFVLLASGAPILLLAFGLVPDSFLPGVAGHELAAALFLLLALVGCALPGRDPMALRRGPHDVVLGGAAALATALGVIPLVSA